MLVELPFPLLDPAAFTIPLPRFDLGPIAIGPLPIRWYALAYIAGLLLGWRYANALAARPRLWGQTERAPVSKLDIDDFAFWAMIGILLGGRLGYVAFYLLPFEPDQLLRDPFLVLRMWEGGMSFHGGLIGVALALIFTAKARKIPLLNLADVAAAATPIGLFLGRIANFINGELYGRPTDAPWAVRFPQWDPSLGQWQYERTNVLGVVEALGSKVPVHPSQLYESALEGVVLFTVLAIAVWRFKVLERPGLATGVFLVGYAAARTFVENFREPDAHIGFLPLGITMGMLLSAPMIIGGAWLIMRSTRTPRPA
ncbi:prolipoprotein diacylglyceryl transferase [bacterium]|nr:prolipoprotein diacylglyceryl transferase [bacterium]